MGEIAEDMIDGSCCSECGQYFKHPMIDEKGESIGIYVHEYPVLCWDCWTKDSELPKSDVETF